MTIATRRPPLTQQEAFAALDAYLAPHGREPTLNEFRQIVGGGNQTLMDARQAWHGARAAAQAARAVPVPEAVRLRGHELLEAVWQLARDAAESRLETDRQALAEERDCRTRDAQEAAGLADQLAEELGQARAAEAAREAEWQARLEAAGAESRRLSGENATLAEGATAQARRSAARARPRALPPTPPGRRARRPGPRLPGRAAEVPGAAVCRPQASGRRAPITSFPQMKLDLQVFSG